jgi:hypothetical protein
MERQRFGRPAYRWGITNAQLKLHSKMCKLQIFTAPMTPSDSRTPAFCGDGWGVHSCPPPGGGWVGSEDELPAPPRGMGGWRFYRYQCTPPPTPAKSRSPALNLHDSSFHIQNVIIGVSSVSETIATPGSIAIEPMASWTELQLWNVELKSSRAL